VTFRLILIATLFAVPSFARSPRYARAAQPLPLMPPSSSPAPAPKVAAYRSGSSVPDATLSSPAPKEKKSKLSALGIGFELGTMGRANKTQSDIAGLQLFIGGRFFARFAATEDIFVVPSLGYFQKRESQGAAGVTQHILEAGVGGYYGVWTGRKARLMVGGVARAEYGIAQISALNSDSSSAGELRFRAGPAMNVAVGLSPDFSFVADIEAGIAMNPTVRVQPGIAAGFIYYLP